jgi:hypothetical protein
MDARNEAAATDLELVDRPGVCHRVEPGRPLVLRPLDVRLVAERARRAQRVRGIGQQPPVDREQVFHPVDVGAGEIESPGTVVPLERRAEARARDLLCKQNLAMDPIGVGQAELDRVLADAGRGQRCFFGRF